jgi:hypothetical protein
VTSAAAVVVTGGSVPAIPPPTQVMVQPMLARTVNVPPGAVRDVAVQTWPHVGDGTDGEYAVVQGVPGPLHVVVAPSPASQVTVVGVAVAVSVMPGRDAVAD